MGADEEYLDNLLKSVSTDSGERKAMTEEEIAALFSTAGTSKTEEIADTEVDDIMALDDEGIDFSAEMSMTSDIDTPFAEESDEPLIDDIDTPFAEESDEPLLDGIDTPFAEESDEPFDSDLDIMQGSGENLSGDYDFVLDELNSAQTQISEPIVEDSEPAAQETESDFLNHEEVQTLLENDADLFGVQEDQSDLVDMESLDVDAELSSDLTEDSTLVMEEIPDTEEIEQGDMLDIASMFDGQEDLSEGVSYDTSGFYDEEESSEGETSEEETFNPFDDMSDIDDLLKAVNWGTKSDENGSTEQTEVFAITEDTDETDAQESKLTDGIYLEDMDQITSEDLEAMLPKEDEDISDALVDDFDLSSLGDSDDADMAELGTLLQMADGDEPFNLLGESEDETPSGNEILQVGEDDKKAAKEIAKQKKAAEKAQRQAEKAAKKSEKEALQAGRKTGFFSKVMTALLEEEEEEEPVKKKQPTEEVIEVDENQDLETLDKEDKEKKKKEKKEKPKKDKAPKKQKEKKEKPKKEKVVDIEPPTQIRKNSIIIVVVFAASLLVLVLLGNAIVEPLISKHNAKEAFEEQQYEECYQLFAGQSLSDEEQRMFSHAGVVLKLQRRVGRYEEYVSLKDKLNALDSLFDAVANYDDWYQEALNCGARAEVEAIYADILDILGTYGVSESEAQTIANLDDVEYTRVVTALAEGESWDAFLSSEGNLGELPDLLPGEMN